MRKLQRCTTLRIWVWEWRGGGGDAKRRMYRSGGLVAYVYIVELRFTKVARKFEYSDREMSATGDLRWLG